MVLTIKHLPERIADGWTWRYRNAAICIFSKFNHWAFWCSEISPKGTSKLHLWAIVILGTRIRIKPNAFWFFWTKVKLELVFAFTLKIFRWIEKSSLVSFRSINDCTIVRCYCKFLLAIFIKLQLQPFQIFDENLVIFQIVPR